MRIVDEMSTDQLEVMLDSDITDETLLFVQQVLDDRYQDDPAIMAAKQDAGDLMPAFLYNSDIDDGVSSESMFRELASPYRG